jgi:hypothetical protein
VILVGVQILVGGKGGREGGREEGRKEGRKERKKEVTCTKT